MKQIENLLSLLNESEIRYVIIGATAFAAHGWVRATVDLDLFIDDEPSNVRRLRDALSRFGYDITDATEEDFRKFKILLRQYDLPLDIHPFVAGIASFGPVWEHRVVAALGAIEAPFACLDDIIRMKRAANRPKDREDLKQLEKLRDLK